jgi:hypothetical protein
MANIKDGKEIVRYRGTKKTIAWLREQAELDGITPSAIISIAVKEKMEREAAKARQLAGAGAA